MSLPARQLSMDSAEGTVLAVRPGAALVRVRATAACARCASGRGCGAGMGQTPRPREVEVRVAPGLDLAPGDRVRLAMEPALLLRAAWVAYGLPVTGMAAGVLAGAAQAGGSDLLQAVFGLAGLAAGFTLGRLRARRDPELSALAPIAVSRAVRAAAGGVWRP